MEETMSTDPDGTDTAELDHAALMGLYREELDEKPKPETETEASP